MALTNPSIPLYNNIDRNLKITPVKVKSKGLLNRNSDIDRSNQKSDLTKPLTTVVNHFMTIRQAREEIKNNEQV
tara:strand:- start:397 stop:618 length:222 start_codon:yes stop_codon:yes gene_type:complete